MCSGSMGSLTQVHQGSNAAIAANRRAIWTVATPRVTCLDLGEQRIRIAVFELCHVGPTLMEVIHRPYATAAYA